ncbi:putative L-lactate dehydrogenase operon regulatory protein [mine drainage metagenome]|uniref:Putative L-lactate dehydrogenase operon regulatory protein n=1 Tax=mine drainage metagenome TaxID=410659 RepID=A0A1J5RNP0_9ZZZZ
MNAAPETPLVWLLRSHPETADDYLEFRWAVARMAARLAAERATQEDMQRITLAFQHLEEAHDSQRLDAEMAADIAFHRAIYRATHNAVMHHIMERLLSLLGDDVFYDRAAFYSHGETRTELMAQHRALYQALARKDAEAAVAAAEAHIRYAGKALRQWRAAQARRTVARRRAGRIGGAEET